MSKAHSANNAHTAGRARSFLQGFVVGWRARSVCRANDDARATALLERLPPLQGDLPVEVGQGLVLIPCDPIYYERHGRALLDSILEITPDQRVHVHLFLDPNAKFDPASFTPNGSAVSVTWEQSAYDGYLKSVYITFVRFIRFWQILRQLQAPALALDADSIVCRPLGPGFSEYRDCDIALILRRRLFKVHRRTLISAVMLMPTQATRRLLRDYAVCLGEALLRGARWESDQALLYFVWKWHARRGLNWKRLDRRFSDSLGRPQSFVRHAKGGTKRR